MFTYDLGSNNATTLLISKVRFLIPDNDEDNYDLQDAEITYLLGTVGNHITATAIKACRWLARKYAKKITFTTEGGARFEMSRRAEVYAARAEELAKELEGGISTVDLDREDGYSDAAASGEYPSRTVYIKV